jgi:hypothetical protein
MAGVDTDRRTDRTAASGRDGTDPVPGWVDWLLGAVVGVVGLALAGVGGWLYADVDRARIAEAVASESVEVEGMTPEEFVTAAVPFVDWLAVGLVATGLVLLAGAAAFLRARRQTRRRARPGETTATFWASAVYGAAATTVASVLPIGASLVGGGVAAHVYDGDGWRVGAATGLTWWAPTVPLVVAIAGGLAAGGAALGDASGGTALGTLVVVGDIVGLAFSVGVGALGGFLVERFA